MNETHTELCGYAKVGLQVMVPKKDFERFCFDRNNPEVQRELCQLFADLIARGDWIELEVEEAICTGP